MTQYEKKEVKEMPNNLGGDQHHPAYGGGGKSDGPRILLLGNTLHRIVGDGDEMHVETEDVKGNCETYRLDDTRFVPQEVRDKATRLRQQQAAAQLVPSDMGPDPEAEPKPMHPISVSFSADVLRGAADLESYVQEAIRSGGKLVIEMPDGSRREV